MRIFTLLAETDGICGVRIGKTIYPKKVSDGLQLFHATNWIVYIDGVLNSKK